MRSSREMDVKVSQEVLGHSVVKQKSGAWVEGTPRGSRPLPAYSK